MSTANAINDTIMGIFGIAPPIAKSKTNLDSTTINNDDATRMKFKDPISTVKSQISKKLLKNFNS